MINAKDIKNFYREVDQESPVDLIKYFNNRIPELRMIVGNVPENCETYTKLAMIHYYITNMRAFAKERKKAIEECERNRFSCLYLAWILFYNQLGLLITEFNRNFNVS